MNDTDADTHTGTDAGTPKHRDTRPPTIAADEKASLLAFLNYVRDALAAKAEGLADDLARTPGVPSGTSLLGLVKHMTGAETVWFEWAFEGRDPYPELGMDVAETDTAESLLAKYRAAIARSNKIIESCDDLERVSVREERTLRWILLHMIEETARHAGHADILREQADGSTGR